MKRRELAEQFGSLLLLVAACRKSEAPAAPDRAKRAALVGPQVAILGAALARVLPKEGVGPSAADAGLSDFVAAELARPEFDLLRRRFQGGLVALDRAARRVPPGKGFVALSPAEQDEVLTRVAAGSETGKKFLEMLVVLALEGLLSDPKYGGNKNHSGWRFAGYPPEHFFHRSAP